MLPSGTAASFWQVMSADWQDAFWNLADSKRACYIQKSSDKKRSGRLKISINVEENVKDIEIAVSCSRLTPEIEKILATLRILDKQLMAAKGEETYILDVSQVVYIESVDRKTFVYTGREVYESSLKLYELEQQLEECGFFRASKSCVVQLKYIKSLKADINRKIKVTLENGEQIMVSRQYAEGLRKKLGVK